MGNLVSCPSCGAQFDADALPAGQSFRCGSCKTVMRTPAPTTLHAERAPATHHAEGESTARGDPAAAPPPLPRRPRKPLKRMKKRIDLGKQVDLDDPDKAVAQKRLRAAKLCSSSLWTGIAAAVCLVITWLGAIGAGVAAVVIGSVGLSKLAAVGPGHRPTATDSPIERVSVRMARRAKGQGVAGVVIGACVLLFLAWIFFAAGSQR